MAKEKGKKNLSPNSRCELQHWIRMALMEKESSNKDSKFYAPGFFSLFSKKLNFCLSLSLSLFLCFFIYLSLPFTLLFHSCQDGFDGFSPWPTFLISAWKRFTSASFLKLERVGRNFASALVNSFFFKQKKKKICHVRMYKIMASFDRIL